ncbi:hypothetical protein BBP00_00003740 [Phytophthora kernoviae]|uniref:Protein kinase domain-containing protein n=1 Tax=Phytophthora kernoviae TaxID=325452 RepID=A0A3F2RTM2_9STRA|nr:hypothetical protein BBP00_00003740 [Phytophthora kernoviae]
MGVCASRRSPSLERFYELDTPAVELGKGLCSRVFRARSRATSALVAVKRLDKEQLRLNDEDPLQWEREVALLRRCASHPNVVALHDVLETPDFVYIIMELAEGGELFQALIDEGAYSEWDARRFITDLLEALRFLHELGIVHSGIHPFDPDGRQTRDQMINNIRLGLFSMNGPRWDAVSGEAKALVSSLLRVEPEQRPTAAETLSHEWFASPRTSRESLAVSLSDTEGLARYCHMMRRKFRSSVLAAVAADTLRRSIKKSRQSAGSVTDDKDESAVEDPSDDFGVSLSDDTGAQPRVKPSQSVLSHIFQHAPPEEDDIVTETAQPSVNTEDITIQA